MTKQEALTFRETIVNNLKKAIKERSDKEFKKTMNQGIYAQINLIDPPEGSARELTKEEIGKL